MISSCFPAIFFLLLRLEIPWCSSLGWAVWHSLKRNEDPSGVCVCIWLFLANYEEQTQTASCKQALVPSSHAALTHSDVTPAICCDRQRVFPVCVCVSVLFALSTPVLCHALARVCFYKWFQMWAIQCPAVRVCVCVCLLSWLPHVREFHHSFVVFMVRWAAAGKHTKVFRTSSQWMWKQTSVMPSCLGQIHAFWSLYEI